MFPTHPFSGVTVPVSGFLIVTRRLRDCVKSRNGEGKGERHIRSAFGASATSRQPLSGGYATLLLFARQSVAYPYAPAFQGCIQVVGYFAAKSAVRFNRLLAFLRVVPFCFSGGVIFFYWKQVQWLYACVVMFSRRIRKSVLPLQLFILSCSHFFRYVEYCMLHSSASFF